MRRVRTRPSAIQAVWACLLVAGAWLAPAGNAVAAPGQIAFDGCLANDAEQGCFDLPFEPLGGARAVAVSPDGRSVYVVSASSIAHLFRSTVTGRLAWDGCLNNDGSQGCINLPGAPLDRASGVAVSPDGKSVYVASAGSNSISHLFRSGPDGQIAWDGCLNNDGSQGCIDLPFDPLTDARGVAVSPDGRSVYVVASSSIAHLFRSTVTGQLAWDGCLNSGGTENCGDLPFNPLTDARGVAVSPDGKSVYVVALGSDSVAHLFRSGPDGQIAWDGCLNNDGSQNCGDLPGAPLDGATGVAVSLDGESVYIASQGSNSIAHLFRSGPDGQIAWDGCLNNDGSQNCGDLPGAPLDGAFGVAVSPDGKSVYVASLLGDSVAHLFRNGPDGQIAWDGCLADFTAGGCGDLPFDPLDGASAVAVSPDGKSVYVASQNSNSIAHFFRELAAPLPPGTPPTPDAPPPPASGPVPGASSADTLAPSISGLGLTNRRFRVGPRATPLAARRVAVGTTFRYTLTEPATVTVAIERAVAGRRYVRAGSRLTRTAKAGPNALRFSGRIGRRKLRPGAYRARFTAIDAAGNRSRTARVRFRVAR